MSDDLRVLPGNSSNYLNSIPQFPDSSLTMDYGTFRVELTKEYLAIYHRQDEGEKWFLAIKRPFDPPLANVEQAARIRELEAKIEAKELDRQYHMDAINSIAKMVGALGETSADVAAKVCAKLETERKAREALQLALFRWHPGVVGDGSVMDEQAADDAYLLTGMPNEETPEYGRSIRERAEIAESRVREIRKETIEECAKVCDNWRRTVTLDECCDTAQHTALQEVAAAIRSKK